MKTLREMMDIIEPAHSVAEGSNLGNIRLNLTEPQAAILLEVILGSYESKSHKEYIRPITAQLIGQGITAGYDKKTLKKYGPEQQGVAEDRNKTKYAKLLAIIAKERQEWITEFTGLPTTKEQKIQRKKEGALYAKAAELFAAGDIDGGSKIITQNIPPQHQDYFRHFMEEYKIPINLVFGDAERNFPAPKGQWTGAFNGDAKLEKKIRARLEQLHDSETMEPEEVYDQVADEFGISTELLDQWLSDEDDDEYYNESADPDAVKRIEQLVQYK